jgi:phosphate starvation-inducible protein PhoH and related proteins
MIEKIFYLDTVDPMIFFGVNNSNFTIIKNAFPKLKIIARDTVIKVNGDVAEIQAFQEKLQTVILYAEKFNALPPTIVRDLMDNKSIAPSGTTEEDFILYGINGRVIKARTKTQRLLVDAIQKNDLVFAIGPAGSGKTYTAVAMAVRALKYKEVKRIILCRPAVEAEESLGFLPGDMREKLNPYLQPLYDALQDMIPAKKLEEMFEENTIQIAPLAYMRGRTLDNAFVILDEAQNATHNQLKMFLTRMGERAKFIVTGDITQIDLSDKSKSGLEKNLPMLSKIKGISVLHFDQKDIIRHRLVKEIVDMFESITAVKKE